MGNHVPAQHGLCVTEESHQRRLTLKHDQAQMRCRLMDYVSSTARIPFDRINIAASIKVDIEN
ncbi:hypothetical protein [Nocardia sp. R6R-6]|uniref:hypothetical protein n=1 Tax=Nocardia sp. R6R-6 TaxID=3459303 RepID=UPI00403E2645